MRFLLTLLAFAGLSFAALTACKSQTASQRQVQQNSSAGFSKAAESSDSVAADEHAHQDDGIARISLEDAKKAYDKNSAIFVDTRAVTSYEANHIKGAINIPAEEFQTRYAEVPKDKQIIAYCS